MPALARLELSNLRNIQSAELELARGFNVLFGDNGSGKTSVLEAVHLLGMGRSFRNTVQKALVTEGHSEATVFGLTSEGLALGISRPLRGPQTLKIGGRRAAGLAELSRSLPLQLINSDTFQILEGSPTERRRFLDWGVFHVEHRFLESWRRVKLALQNRNSLLRSDAKAVELEPWTLELVKGAESMDQQRQAYISKLKAVVEPQLAALGAWEGAAALEIDYWRGWGAEQSLYELLQQELPRDRKNGHTGSGPHRAELHFSFGMASAADLLSRGQIKLLICALKIAQAELLEQQTGQRCLFLIDDLPAELDAFNRARVCRLLAGRQCQILLTSIERDTLASELGFSPSGKDVATKLFHVKHGKIVAV